MEQYLHVTDQDDDINIHDCKATDIILNDDQLSFVFRDGFFVMHDHSFDDEKLHKTDASVMTLHLVPESLADDFTIYVFEEKKKKTIRRALSMDALIELLRSQKAELEFLYLYKGYQSYLFQCMLCTDKKPYQHECVLLVQAKGISFHWNNILKNSVW